MTIEAVVLRSAPYREHDLFVVLYSPQLGKCAAIAKGSMRAQSRQAAALDGGNHIECRLVEANGLPIITGARTIRCFSSAKSEPVAWAAAQFFLQACDAIIFDREPDMQLWAVLTGALAALDDAGEPIATMRHHQMLLLDVLGYGRADVPPATALRSPLDDEFERIANRKLASIDLVYSLARGVL